MTTHNFSGEGPSHEAQSFTPSPIDPDASPEYLVARRMILGPSADITHPEFGRDNTPEETFGFRSEVNCPSKWSIHTTPKVFDSNGKEVDPNTFKLKPFNDGLQTGNAQQDWIDVTESG
ncbi:MAG: hypothetical protein ACREGC_00835 [Minisyncoccia bacterium]